jgi:hypothetical protein
VIRLHTDINTRKFLSVGGWSGVYEYFDTCGGGRVGCGCSHWGRASFLRSIGVYEILQVPNEKTFRGGICH